MAPQSLIAKIDDDEWRGFAVAYSRLVLCETQDACGRCASCRAWLGDEHPDMVIAGPGDRPVRMSVGSVRECDEFQMTISLLPVVANRRVGVLPFADRMSIEAKNAMLKTAEEPPSGVSILFIARDDIAMPTISSRSRSFRPELAPPPEPSPPPKDAGEWARWLASGRKKNIRLSDIASDLAAWSMTLAGEGRWQAAGDLQMLAQMSDKRRMPIAMVQDAAHAILREGARVEQLFSDLWEA